MLLLNHYLEKFNRTYGRGSRIARKAIDVLSTYAWPGNVRCELANTVERLVIMTEASTLTPSDLPPTIFSAGDGHHQAVTVSAQENRVDVAGLQRWRWRCSNVVASFRL